jgi:hypothetical protein
VIGTPLLNHASMPSGHALTAGAVATVLAAALGLRGWRVLLPFVLAVAVALSRIAVGAHWPADVLAGAGLGLGWGCCPCGWRPAGRRPGWERPTASAAWPCWNGAWRWPWRCCRPACRWPPRCNGRWPSSGCAAAFRAGAMPGPAGTDQAVARLVLPSLAAGLLLAMLLREGMGSSC